MISILLCVNNILKVGISLFEPEIVIDTVDTYSITPQKNYVFQKAES